METDQTVPSTAHKVYVAHVNEIQGMLAYMTEWANLMETPENAPGFDPLTWAHVGDIAYVKENLRAVHARLLEIAALD